MTPQVAAGRWGGPPARHARGAAGKTTAAARAPASIAVRRPFRLTAKPLPDEEEVGPPAVAPPPKEPRSRSSPSPAASYPGATSAACLVNSAMQTASYAPAAASVACTSSEWAPRSSPANTPTASAVCGGRLCRFRSGARGASGNLAQS
ncbi:hypothetical protein GCM10010211_78550 [Streptomyces albospinus]|uniref:Uncharacterized protein n=1 Tax=Streptomyces albospinus TaxID=285515 RepID=A0ABQ2VNB1_9ACTN|nr:hypothetical protein GCM10010211_78550 [Streptomyces albospinus]